MITIGKTEVMGWESAIRGMRNPMNSWDKSDSGFGCRLKKGRDNIVGWDEYHHEGDITFCKDCQWIETLCAPTDPHDEHREFIIGPNDHDLMMRLAKAGSVEGKFRRMITVYVDITAPLYWWKEFDTYKVGTVANSCSTMHKIHDKEFALGDFSHEHLFGVFKGDEYDHDCWLDNGVFAIGLEPIDILRQTVDMLNKARELYLDYKKKAEDGNEFAKEHLKEYWWQMIQLLPSSYNQKRTIMLNYEVLANIYQHRRNHKLDEWREFCKWIENLPYSEIIIANQARGE